MTIPGVGPVTASAIMATIQDIGDFASGREFAAFLGLTPRQSSTGGKPRLGRITKMGDRYLRKLLVVGAVLRSSIPLAHRRRASLWPLRWRSVAHDVTTGTLPSPPSAGRRATRGPDGASTRPGSRSTAPAQTAGPAAPLPRKSPPHRPRRSCCAGHRASHARAGSASLRSRAPAIAAPNAHRGNSEKKSTSLPRASLRAATISPFASTA